MSEVSAQAMAAADQELAAVDAGLDRLVAYWRGSPADDRVFRIAKLMAEMQGAPFTGVAAYLAVAVERLAG